VKTMRQELFILGRLALRLGGIILAALLLGSGCDSTGNSSGAWGKPAAAASERWTINCLRSSAPNHVELCNGLAELLRRTNGIDSKAVRVQSDALGSTIYYGEYTRVAGAGGQLVFPAKMQQDIDRISHLTYNQTLPFGLAAPESLGGDTAGGGEGQYNLTTARGKYSLLIAVFYNTPTFDQRREVAEQYTQQLRSEGVEAYVFHELVKSYVFVGSFGENALTTVRQPARSPHVWTPAQTWEVSKEVQDFAAARAGEEFLYLTENGHRQKRVGPDGQSILVPSQLTRVPRPGATSLYDHGQ